MKFGYSEVCLAHDTGDRHPESPDRLRAIRSVLDGRPAVEYADGEAASAEQLEAVHDEAYVSDVRAFCANGGGQWDPDTIAVEETWDAALHSAGLAGWAVDAALDGASGPDTPFSLGRPPGHHATIDDAMGFCFFNNVAVATQDVIARGAVDRVAIVDWDVHHGNGTEDIFYDRGDVLYASMHEERIFPGTGAIDRTGAGAGAGATINVPLPAGSGDAAYAAVTTDVVVPAVTRFDPDLLVVSAGFDAHEHDPISRMHVTRAGFGFLAARIREVATAVDAPLAFVLEGGYSLDNLAESIATVNDVFADSAPTDPPGPPGDAVADRIDRARAVHGLGS